MDAMGNGQTVGEAGRPRMTSFSPRQRVEYPLRAAAVDAVTSMTYLRKARQGTP